MSSKFHGAVHVRAGTSGCTQFPDSPSSSCDACLAEERTALIAHGVCIAAHLLCR